MFFFPFPNFLRPQLLSNSVNREQLVYQVFLILYSKFCFTSGESNLQVNAVNYQNILSRSVVKRGQFNYLVSLRKHRNDLPAQLVK